MTAAACAVGAGTPKAEEAESPLLGAGMIAISTFFWGLDNNVTRRIAARDAVGIATAKCLVAGGLNLVVALALGHKGSLELLPLAGVAGVGILAYGLSLVLFIRGLERMGAARTGTLFASAPASGVLLAWLALGETPSMTALAGGATMIACVAWMASARRAPTDAPGPPA